MVLYIHSNASYLSEPNACSRMGGHFFLSSPPLDSSSQTLATDKPPPENGAIHVNSTILKVVVASAAEAETGAMFYNSQDAVPMRVFSPRWAIRNLQPTSAATTVPPSASPTKPSNSAAPNQWTCAIFGSKIATPKASSNTIGTKKEKATAETTTQNITALRTINI
jgi:hypothetical protein